MPIADAGEAVLVPSIGARSRVIVGKVVPGGAVGAVVLADGAPGPLAEIRPPSLPMADPLPILFEPPGLGSEAGRRCRGICLVTVGIKSSMDGREDGRARVDRGPAWTLAPHDAAGCPTSGPKRAIPSGAHDHVQRFGLVVASRRGVSGRARTAGRRASGLSRSRVRRRHRSARRNRRHAGGRLAAARARDRATRA